MVREDKAAWKANYFKRIVELFEEYPKLFVVEADNVGSKQMQQIRISLRGRAVILMGKNTMMRKALRGILDSRPELERLLPHIRGNVGFVFTKEDLVETRDLLLKNKVKAPARAGAIAPLDVVVPAQNTGLGPEKTSFFQALNIPTKITKGTIEIIQDVSLIKTGAKVGLSDATLLNMLKISPFTYGLIVIKVYDSGSLFEPAILDITQDDMVAKLRSGIQRVAALSLAARYPTAASAPHSMVNGVKRLLAVAAVTDITFKEAETMKAYLANPEAFAAAAAAPAQAAANKADAAGDNKGKAAAAADDDDEEEDEDMGFGLFD